MTTAIEYAIHNPAVALEWLIIVLAWTFAAVVAGWYLDQAWADMRKYWGGWTYPPRGFINAFGFFVFLLIVLLLLTRVTVFLLTMH